MRTIIFIFLTSFSQILFSQPKEANLLGSWQDSTLVGSNIHKNVYNEVWGYATKGHEYAIIGTTAGTHFIEVTDPTLPKEAFFIAGKDQGGVIIHRDYHDYQDYLYAVSDEGNSSLQIIDLSELPDTVKVVYDSDELVKRSHNIFIDTTNAKLYTLISRGGVSNWSAMNVFDISNPLEPLFLREYNSLGGMPISQVHDAFVRDNIAFLNLGPNGFAIADFSDPMNAITLSTLTDYPAKGYNHSGWLTDDCQYYYMADENHGFDMKTLSVSNLCEPDVESTFNAAVDIPTSIVHNQVVACNYLYTAYYYDGLRVYNLDNPAAPELELFYDTYLQPDSTLYRGAWGVYPFLPSGNILLSDMQSGLFVFEGMGDNCHLQEKPICNLNANCLTTSINESRISPKISIYPNPIADDFWLTVNLLSTSFPVQMTLTDVSGAVCQKWNLESLPVTQRFSLNEEVLPGFYFLSLRVNGEVWTEKVFVLK